MFKLELASQFYLQDAKVPLEVRKAWYIFAYKILPMVNGDWLRNLQGIRAKNRVNMFRIISTSDEAFARWTLEVRWKKINEVFMNGETPSRKFEKPKGAHDSLAYGNRYREIYDEVKRGRTKESETIYNNWFWTYFQHHNPLLFQETTTISRETVVNAARASLPDQDEARPVSSYEITQNYAIDDEDRPSTSHEMMDSDDNHMVDKIDV
jgi:hypothetical protein